MPSVIGIYLHNWREKVFELALNLKSSHCRVLWGEAVFDIGTNSIALCRVSKASHKQNCLPFQTSQKLFSCYFPWILCQF